MDAILHLTKRREGQRDTRSGTQFLESLDLGASSFLQQGRLDKALDYLEEALRQRQHRLGLDSPEVLAYARGIARKIVPLACGLIEKGEGPGATQLLHRVEAVLTVDLPSELCDLMSALSCAYRKQAKQTLARQYALRALAVVNAHPSVAMDRTNAYLTMCAALSAAGEHAEALDYALRAIQCSQEELVEATLGKSSEASRKMPVLAVAYHNAGVEAEYIVKYDIAMEWYQKALRFVRQHREECPKLRDMEKIYQAAVFSLDKKMSEAACVSTAARPPAIPKFKSTTRTEGAALSDRSGVRRKTSRPATAVNRFQSPKLPSERTSKASKIRLAFSRQQSPDQSHKFFPSSTETSVERVPLSSSPRYLAQVHTEGDLDEREIGNPGLSEFSLEVTPRDARIQRLPLRFKASTRKPTNPPHFDSFLKTDSDVFPKAQEVNLRSKVDEGSLMQKNSGSEENAPSSPTSSFPSSLQVSFRAPIEVTDKPESEEEKEAADLLEEMRTEVVVSKKKEEKLLLIDPKREQKGENYQVKEDNFEDKRKAAVRIQAGIRRILSKSRVKLLQNAAKRLQIRTLRNRTVKQFPQGLGIVQIYQQTLRPGLIATVTGPSWPIDLPFLPIPEGLNADSAANQLQINAGKLEITPKSDKNRVPTEVIVKIQALLRGAVARKRAFLLRNSYRKGRKVIFRSCQHLNGKFLTLSLVKSGEELAVVQDTEDLSKPIPEAFKSLPPHELLNLIRLRGDSIDFPGEQPELQKAETGLSLLSSSFGNFGITGKRKSPRPITTELPPPSENPASPSSVPSSMTHSLSPKSSDIDEPLKPTEKPSETAIEFVSDTGSDYLAVEENEQTINRFEEAEAVSETEEREEGIIVREEVSTSNGVFLVSIIEVDTGLIEVSALPVQSSDPEPGKTTYDEGILRAEFNCEAEEPLSTQAAALLNDFAVVNNTAVLTRLQISPFSPSIDDFSVPKIVICDSSSPVLGSQTASLKVVASPQRLSECAIRIQCAWRRHMAKSQLPLLKGRVQLANLLKVFSCYRLFPNKAAFQVQIYQKQAGVTIKATDVSKQREHCLELHQEKDYHSLDFEEISRRMWTKGESLGVFVLDSITNRHHQATTTIAKVGKGWLARKAVRRLRQDSARQVQACRVKEFDGLRLGLMSFLMGSKLQIECFRIHKAASSKAKSRFTIFSMRELSSIYPSPLNHRSILDDVSFEDEQLILQSRVSKLQTRQKTILSSKTMHDTRSIIRTSRRLDDKMWVITMGIIGTSEDLLRPSEDDIVEFSAFSTSQQKPLTVKTTVEELANLTKLSAGNIYPIGTLTIQKLLKVKDGALIIDHTEKVPDINSLATYLQAHVRGFITRRKMLQLMPSKSPLITCITVSLEGAQWIMYGYREPPFIRMEAVHRIHKTVLSTLISDTIFNKFPPTLTKKRIIDNFIIPKLHIVTEEGTRHLRTTKSMQIQQSLLEKHQGKIKVLTQNVGREAAPAAGKTRKGFGPLTSLILKTGAKEGPQKGTLAGSPGEDSEGITGKESEDSSSDGSLSPVPRLAVPAEEFHDSSSLALSFMGDGPIKATKPIEEEKKSSEPEAMFAGRKEVRKETRTEPLLTKLLRRVARPLLLKSGFEQDGSYYIVSMSGDTKAILVEFEDQHTNEKASKEVNISSESVDNLELYCTRLLNRMTLSRSSSGNLTVSLTDQTPHVLSVLYKKSHYVSNRYCIVTVNQTSVGITVSCYDPERQLTLDMALGQRKHRSADLLQKDIADLVKRLRIGEVMGEATLTLALG